MTAYDEAVERARVAREETNRVAEIRYDEAVVEAWRVNCPRSSEVRVAALVAERTRPAQGCPRCGSTAPHLHPAVQEGGEVSPCPDRFHAQVTPENTNERIGLVRALAERTRLVRGPVVEAPTPLTAPTLREALEGLLARAPHSPFCIPCSQGTPCEVARARAALDAPVQGAVSAADVSRVLMQHLPDTAAGCQAIAALIAERTRPVQARLTLEQRHWSGPGEIGDMPSVESTLQDVEAGLAALDAPAPASTPLAAAHARLRAIVSRHGMGTSCLGLQVWDHEDGRRSYSWTATAFLLKADPRYNAEILQVYGSTPDEALDALEAKIAPRAQPPAEVAADVAALGELPEVQS